MNEFIEKNRKMLEFYHFASRIIGWVLIGITPFLLILSIFSWLKLPIQNEAQLYGILNSLSKTIMNSLMLGIIVLCVARFIKYLYSEEIEPGWFLRQIKNFLYIYAFIVLASILIEYKNPSMSPDVINLQTIALYFLPLLLFKVALALIIIGLGHIFHRILPVIEESKTLV